MHESMGTVRSLEALPNKHLGSGPYPVFMAKSRVTLASVLPLLQALKKALC